MSSSSAWIIAFNICEILWDLQWKSTREAWSITLFRALSPVIHMFLAWLTPIIVLLLPALSKAVCMSFAWGWIVCERLRRKKYSYPVMKCEMRGRRKSPKQTKMSEWVLRFFCEHLVVPKPHKAKGWISDSKKGLNECNKQYW